MLIEVKVKEGDFKAFINTDHVVAVGETSNDAGQTVTYLTMSNGKGFFIDEKADEFVLRVEKAESSRIRLS